MFCTCMHGSKPHVLVELHTKIYDRISRLHGRGYWNTEAELDLELISLRLVPSAMNSVLSLQGFYVIKLYLIIFLFMTNLFAIHCKHNILLQVIKLLWVWVVGTSCCGHASVMLAYRKNLKKSCGWWKISILFLNPFATLFVDQQLTAVSTSQYHVCLSE